MVKKNRRKDNLPKHEFASSLVPLAMASLQWNANYWPWQIPVRFCYVVQQMYCFIYQWQQLKPSLNKDSIYTVVFPVDNYLSYYSCVFISLVNWIEHILKAKDLVYFITTILFSCESWFTMSSEFSYIDLFLQFYILACMNFSFQSISIIYFLYFV